MYIVDGNIILRAVEKEDNDVLRALINDPYVESKVEGWSFPVSEEKQMQWYQAVIDNHNLSAVRFAVQVDSKCVGMAACNAAI